MLQVLLREPGRFEACRGERPRPGQGEALLRIRRIGVCGTDLHAFRGRQPFFSYPRVLGHELAGEVVEIAANARGIRVGDRVAVEPYLSCGMCRPCREGRYNCCASLQVLGVHCDGGMQEWLAAPVHLLHRSDSLSLDQLALVETLGIGFHAVERGAVVADEWVVVVGAGPIGLAAMQFAAVNGAHVVAVDLSRVRLDSAARLGAEHVLEAGDTALDTLTDLAGPELAHCVFDATGSLESMAASLRFAGPGGRLVMVGLAQGSFAVDDPIFHRRELSISSSRNSAGAFPAIIAMLEQGRLDTGPWITHRLALGDVPTGFPALLEPAAGVLKAVISAD